MMDEVGTTALRCQLLCETFDTLCASSGKEVGHQYCLGKETLTKF